LLLLTLALSGGLSVPAFGDEAPYVTRAYQAEALGKPLGASVSGGNPTATQTVEANADVTILGKSLNALNARVESPAALSAPATDSPDQIDIGGTSYTTVYSFGKAILDDSWFISSGGYNNVKLGLAPTEVRVPFVIYPVGPLTLNVAGGARFQANLDATLVPEVALPIQDSTLGVQLSAKAEAAGFVEAYAAILIIRGGVGGQVDLINGHLDVNGRVAFNGNKPVVIVNGIVQFFSGRFYAFLDIFGFLKLGWKRLIDKDLYAWTGICYSMGYLQCPAK
jgi:hypothetical protein